MPSASVSGVEKSNGILELTNSINIHNKQLITELTILDLQQMKRHKSEDGAASTVSIKSEQTSPIPEGSYSHVDFNSIVLHCGLSDILAKTTLTS